MMNLFSPKLFTGLLLSATAVIAHAADNPLDLFNAWADAQGIPAGQRGPDDCPAGDGIPNLLKYATGVNALTPTAQENLFSWTVNEEADSIEMLFLRSKDAEGVVLTPEFTPTLNADMRDIRFGLERIATDSTTETWHASFPLNLKGFFRLTAGIDSNVLRNRYRSPLEVAYNQAGNWLATSDREQGVVYFINTSAATPFVQHRVVLHGEPCGIDWAPNNHLFVAEYGANTIAEIAFVSGEPEVIRRIPVTGMPYDVKVASSVNKLVVSEYGLGLLHIVDMNSGAVEKTLQLPSNGSFIDINSTDTIAVVANLVPGNESAFDFTSSAKVTLVDILSGKILTNVALPAGASNVRDVQISLDDQWAYIAHTYGSVAMPTNKLDNGWVNANAFSIIDLTHQTRLTTLLLDASNEGWANPWGLAISPDGKTLWITSDGTHRLGKIPLETLHKYLDGSINEDGNGGGANGKLPLTLTVLPQSNGTYNVLVEWETFIAPNFDSDGFDDNYTVVRNGGKRSDWPGKPLPNSYLDKGVPEGLNVYQVFPYEGDKNNPIGEYVGQVAVGEYAPEPPDFGSDVWGEIWAGNMPLIDLQRHFSALRGSDLFSDVDLPAKGPRGVDTSPVDGTVAIASYFTGEVLLVNPANGWVKRTVNLGPEPAQDAVRRGQIHFADAKIARQFWVACTTCHPEARTDGLNWDLGNDGLGTYKNTKSLVGAEYTAPTTWTGIRLDATQSIAAGFLHIHFADVKPQVATDTQAYLAWLRPDPSPYLVFGELSDKAILGRKIFQQEGCTNCHKGEWMTDLKLHNVGSGSPVDGGVTKFDTPSIVEMWRTGPYLHDGRATSLKEAFKSENGNTHDITSLSAPEQEALIEYVLSL